MHPVEIRHARDLAEAVAWLAQIPGARIIAGGTAIGLETAPGAGSGRQRIALARIDGLAGISQTAGGMRIGALCALGDLERSAEVATGLPLLRAAIQTVAAPAVRNLATLGGNIAGRTGCLLPALLALDADVEGTSADGAWRRTLSDWLARPARADEIIVAIHLPTQFAGPPEVRWTQRKIGLRAAFTPAVIGVAGIVATQGGVITAARLAVGGGTVRPTRLVGAEALLVDVRLDRVDWPRLRAALEAEIDAPADAFRSARYRRIVAANALTFGLGGAFAPLPVSRAPAPSPGARPPAGEIAVSHAAQPARWHVRPDGPAKVAGRLPYLTDHRTPDMLVGRILRAGHPHARIRSIDTSRAEALPGVLAVVTHRDVSGRNAFGIVIQDQPAFCVDTVRYVGDAVAAVAALDARTAQAALDAIVVAYEPLPVVTDPIAALDPDAPRVHAGGNLLRSMAYARGDVAAAFAASAHIIEDTYVTPRQMHGFLETEGGWAALEPDGTLAIHCGGQHGPRDRLQLARILGWPADRIRVVTSPTGGAFGGKDELTVQPALALLARKAGRPVRIALARAESVIAGVKRHPMRIRMRTGCDAAGRILAQQVDVLADAGAYASLGPAVLETALEHAAGPYSIANVETRGRLVYTNNGVGGAFRGFGANQMAFAVECQLDRLAQRCGLSPVEIRRRNLKRPDEPGYFGQRLAASERLAPMLAGAEASPLWARRGGAPAEAGSADAASDEIVGVGMAMNYHGNGLGSVIPDPAGGSLRLAADGRIEAAFTLDEFGQGLLAAIVSTVADELGCGRDDVRPVTGATSTGPDSGSTTASRGTFVVWQTSRLAAPALRVALCAAAGRVLARDPATLRVVPGGIAERDSTGHALRLGFAELARALPAADRPAVERRFDFPTTDYRAGNARLIFASGSCVARVAVSRVTGAVRVLDLEQHSAAGPIVDLAAYLGQLEGGAVQGLGFTLTEAALMDAGTYVSTNFDTYLMPSVADAPARMPVFALEELDPGDPFGPRGVGELGIGAVTPAIANAVLDAIGYCPTACPISPETVLDALAREPFATPIQAAPRPVSGGAR